MLGCPGTGPDKKTIREGRLQRQSPAVRRAVDQRLARIRAGVGVGAAATPSARVKPAHASCSCCGAALHAAQASVLMEVSMTSAMPQTHSRRASATPAIAQSAAASWAADGEGHRRHEACWRGIIHAAGRAARPRGGNETRPIAAARPPPYERTPARAATLVRPCVALLVPASRAAAFCCRASWSIALHRALSVESARRLRDIACWGG